MGFIVENFNEHLVKKGLRKLGYSDENSDNYLRNLERYSVKPFYLGAGMLAFALSTPFIDKYLPNFSGTPTLFASILGNCVFVATQRMVSLRALGALRTLENLGRNDNESPPEEGLDDIIKKLPTL